jgi:hypothetical protein
MRAFLMLFYSRVGALLLMGMTLILLGVGIVAADGMMAAKFSATVPGEVTQLWTLGARSTSYWVKFDYQPPSTAKPMQNMQCIRKATFDSLKLHGLVTVFYIPDQPSQSRVEPYTVYAEELSLIAVAVGFVIMLSSPLAIGGGRRAS